MPLSLKTTVRRQSADVQDLPPAEEPREAAKEAATATPAEKSGSN